MTKKFQPFSLTWNCEAPGTILTKRQLLEKLWDIDGDFVDEHEAEPLLARTMPEEKRRECPHNSAGMGNVCAD